MYSPLNVKNLPIDLTKYNLLNKILTTKIDLIAY